MTRSGDVFFLPTIGQAIYSHLSIRCETTRLYVSNTNESQNKRDASTTPSSHILLSKNHAPAADPLANLQEFLERIRKLFEDHSPGTQFNK